ncbi:MAG: PIG-L family deacetylase [Eubacterium sp.]|nr:PIG-L family deacetylase [Eubacterium sp.]
MEHSRKKKIIKILLITSISIFAVLCAIQLYIHLARKKAYDVQPLTEQQIQAVTDNKKARKLMIVAHPDDDTIWGGAHLMSGDYFIVCITNGRNKTRKAEFLKMLSQSGNSGYILEYPDKVAGMRDNWKEIRDQLQSDLEKIMECKDWELIVTHNTAGEYGHQHHKYTHKIVTEIYDRNSLKPPLFNFGEYHSKKNLPEFEKDMTKISDKEYEYKCELVKVYASQDKTVNKLYHMLPYEMWTQYEQYSENPQFKK